MPHPRITRRSPTSKPAERRVKRQPKSRALPKSPNPYLSDQEWADYQAGLGRMTKDFRELGQDVVTPFGPPVLDE